MKEEFFLSRTEDAEDAAITFPNVIAWRKRRSAISVTFPNVIAWRKRRSAISVPEGKMMA